jgi:large subunit ribosomal protein L32e
MTKEDIIKEFTALKGVGKAKAELLYDNGFDSLDKLKKASIEDLAKVKGVNDKFAKEIKDQLGVTKTKPKDVKKPKEKIEPKVEKAPEKKEEEKKAEVKEEEAEIVEEEEEEEYKTKKKPELSKELKDKLIIRRKIKKRTPDFLREEWFRYKKLSKNWRRPDGISSKMRRNYKYRPNKVRIGYRGPNEVRGLHSSGFEEIIVYNVKDLEGINPKTQAARIGGSVGTKKRIDIEKKAEELDVRVLNL